MLRSPLPSPGQCHSTNDRSWCRLLKFSFVSRADSYHVYVRVDWLSHFPSLLANYPVGSSTLVVNAWWAVPLALPTAWKLSSIVWSVPRLLPHAWESACQDGCIFLSNPSVSLQRIHIFRISRKWSTIVDWRLLTRLSYLPLEWKHIPGKTTCANIVERN